MSNDPTTKKLFGEYGVVAYDEDRDLVQCHLCGRWLKWISPAHLSHRHGYTTVEYRAVHGLSAAQPLMGDATRAKYRAAMIARLENREISGPFGDLGLRSGTWQSVRDARPELEHEFDRERNGELTLASLGVWSTQLIWWICQNCGHRWQSTVRGRASNATACPACGPRHAAHERGHRKRGTISRRSLAALRPDLVRQLDAEHNEDINPELISVWSKQKLHWRCVRCGHLWSARVFNRHQGTGCPECAK